MKNLVVCWGVVMLLCWPAFAETILPERERMEVAGAYCELASFLPQPARRGDSEHITRPAW